MVTAPESWKPGAHCSARRQLDQWESALVLFAGDPGLTWQLCWSQSSLQLDISGREEPSECGQFPELSETVLCCLPSCLRSFYEGWSVSNLEET